MANLYLDGHVCNSIWIELCSILHFTSISTCDPWPGPYTQWKTALNGQVMWPLSAPLIDRCDPSRSMWRSLFCLLNVALSTYSFSSISRWRGLWAILIPSWPHKRHRYIYPLDTQTILYGSWCCFAGLLSLSLFALFLISCTFNSNARRTLTRP